MPSSRGLALSGRLLLVLVTGACGGATEPGAVPGLTLAAARDAYTGGDTVRVRLTNGTASAVGYNLCFAFLGLERRGTWSHWAPLAVSLAPAPNVGCAGPLYGLSPGGEAEGAAFLPRDLPPGVYRLTARVEVGGRDRPVATGAFAVRDH